jgi:PKD repeat protein
MGSPTHAVRPFTRRRLTSLAAATAMSAVSLVVVAAPAHATSQVTTLNFTGDSTLQSRSFSAGCDACIPGSNSGIGVRLTASVSAHWTPSAVVSYQYTQSQLRQGQVLDLTDTLVPVAGALSLTWGLSGDAGIYYFTEPGQPAFPAAGSQNGVVTIDDTVTDTSVCPLRLNGDGSYSCQATHSFSVFDASFLGQGVEISVPVTTTVSIDPDGIVAVRSVTAGGSTLVGPNPLSFNGPSPAIVNDNFVVPCAAVPGNDAIYDLTSSTTTPSFESTTTAGISVDITVIFTVNVLDETIVTIGPDSGSMTLTAPSTPVDFGPILANNVPPTVVNADTYTGTEGHAVQFDASGTTSLCPGTLTYVWNFSDGGIAFGSKPQHTFTDNSLYSGLLTVSDANGNTSKQSFAVTVGNVAPSANAGPDTSAAWGRLVAFNGSALDASSVDQQTLSSTWNFGDGTPPLQSASGGLSTLHAYAAPGTYAATLTVCDKDGACSAPSTRTITIVKRDATLSYLGDHSGTYDTAANLSASLVDQYGQAVNAAGVSYVIGAESEGTSGTNSSGLATKTSTLGLAAGAYGLTASYAGNVLYNPATATASFAVAVKGTTVVYTGSLTGAPNKTITLSGTVTDASGKPLAGKLVTFVLGTQTKTATTNSSGIAATTLALNQKNGSYTLTASFAGTAGLYAGSATAATFKLQAK